MGKHATTEAIAQANKKLFLVITCGDMCFSAKDVEDALTNTIFRLADLLGVFCFLMRPIYFSLVANRAISNITSSYQVRNYKSCVDAP